MNYLSVCSGIEAATVAWHDMGWNPLAFSEIEKFPSEALKHHYPTVPNLGDMTKYKEWDFGTNRLDLLVGGTPCQSFSVAGLRKGLDDPRGNLALVYCGILDKFRPKWFVWENVPGVLSSNRGRDFGAFLGALVELGYGFSYRVLDAQHFGVAQRRRRVFVVGHLGDWKPTAKVLFESESLSRHTPKSRKKGETTTTSFVPSVANCLQTTSNDYSRADGFNMISTKITGPLTAKDYKGISADDCNPEMAKIVAQVYENHGTDSRIKPVDVSPTVTARWGTGGNNVPLAHAFKVRGGCNGGGKGYLGKDEQAFTLSTVQDQQIAIGSCEKAGTLRANPGSGFRSDGTPVEGVAIQNMAVRRLTPVECERLQGFPDNYTNIKENCPDGPRYKALGNSMAVPVMKWIGNRIQMVEDGLI
jgi:DNA (cytosine-5)-methyltransferase 1